MLRFREILWGEYAKLWAMRNTMRTPTAVMRSEQFQLATASKNSLKCRTLRALASANVVRRAVVLASMLAPCLHRVEVS